MSTFSLFSTLLLLAFAPRTASENAAFPGRGVAPDLSVGVLPELFVHGDHFSVGQQIGYATKDSIAYRLKNSPSLYNLLEWVRTTSEGADAYNALLTTANSTFPEYVTELQGVAYGSGANFGSLFVLNVRNELQSFRNDMSGSESGHHGVEHCSDYLLNALQQPEGEAPQIVIGHNEDGGWESRDESALITVHVEGSDVREAIRFTAFVYAGELPTDAFFWNEHGVVGTMNGLYPVHCRYGGLGRNFVSRHLVGATSVQEAVQRATIPNQATGHSFNFASLYEQRLVNVEVAPNTAKGLDGKNTISVVTPITAKHESVGVHSSLFHANSYIFLDVEEDPSESSAHRMARAAELPAPTCARDLLVVLGDTKDADWPIYRTSEAVDDSQDTGYTLVTAQFLLPFPSGDIAEDATVTLFMNNPKTNADVNISMPLAVQR